MSCSSFCTSKWRASKNKNCSKRAAFDGPGSEAVSSHSNETGLVIYLAFLAKVANLHYTILTAFMNYWPNIVAKFISGTQETFIQQHIFLKVDQCQPHENF